MVSLFTLEGVFNRNPEGRTRGEGPAALRHCSRSFLPTDVHQGLEPWSLIFIFLTVRETWHSSLRSSILPEALGSQVQAQHQPELSRPLVRRGEGVTGTVCCGVALFLCLAILWG